MAALLPALIFIYALKTPVSFDMSSNTNTGTGPIKDSSYYLSIVDDTYGELGGPYF
ncbi:MAG: hypothetical protein GYA02_14140 [Clostridiaceae bacterium]|nr:hypothetical protein [Clostridiaceae bacterium]